MTGIGRAEFISGGLAAAVFARSAFADNSDREPVRAVLLHLGHNMWCEWLPESIAVQLKEVEYKRPDLKLVTDELLWRKVTDHASAKGMNTVVIDIGEALVYPSHPELGVEGSWSPEKLCAELKRLRGLGLEPIPKLNFSATHDAWLKDYHRMLTLPKWYEVAKDVINDVIDIFGKPRLFHLGWDEEYVGYAKGRRYFVMRSDEMWWHDFLYTVKCVEDRGVRPWVWSDYGWKHPEYFTRCPKSVVQSNWYYDEVLGGFDLKDYRADHHRYRLEEFYKLEESGFDQIPCGTNWVGNYRKRDGFGADDVIGKLVKLGREVISKDHRLGFMMAPWQQCDTSEHADFCNRGIDLFADALEGRIHPMNRVRM